MSSISSGDKNKRSQAHSLGSKSKTRKQGRKGPITLCTRPLSEKRTRTLRKRRPNTKVHHQQDPIWAYNAILCNVPDQISGCLMVLLVLLTEGSTKFDCPLPEEKTVWTYSITFVLMIMWVQYIRYVILIILCGKTCIPKKKREKKPSNIFTLGRGVPQVLMNLFFKLPFSNLVNDGEEKEDTVKGAKYA